MRSAVAPALSRMATNLVWLGLALLLFLPAPVQAQRRLPPAGTHIFRRLLDGMGMEPLPPLRGLDTEQERTILIVHGDPRNALSGKNRLSLFLRAGGAVLFASDQAVTDESVKDDLCRLSGCAIDGGIYYARTESNGDPSFYKSKECPILKAVAGAEPDLFRVKGGLGARLRVATNLPSYLRPIVTNQIDGIRPFQIEGIRTLAELPFDAYPAATDQPHGLHQPGRMKIQDRSLRPWIPKRSGLDFARGGTVGKGRLLVLADHSLFINAMMMPDDSDKDNIEFTVNCLRYLQGEDRSRNQVLFLEEGRLNSNFKVPLKEIPGLSDKAIRALLATLDDQLAALEEQDAYNRSIWDWLQHRGVTPDRLRNAGVIAGTILLLAYACFRLMRVRRSGPEPALPLLEQVVPARTTATSPGLTTWQSLLAQRHREMIQTANLWDNARRLARETFLAAGIEPGAQPRSLPRIAVPGRWWQRWKRVTRIRWLWRLAFDSRPVRVWPSAWSALVEELEQLRADLSRGTVQIQRTEG